jgi:hypothetical protein
MTGWHVLGCRLNVACLVVKKEVGLKLFEKFAFGQAA